MVAWNNRLHWVPEMDHPADPRDEALLAVMEEGTRPMGHLYPYPLTDEQPRTSWRFSKRDIFIGAVIGWLLTMAWVGK